MTADIFGDSSSPSRLQAALSYARLGWAVLPLHTAINGLCSCGRANCSSPGKHPRTAHGVKDATTNEATIREWWQQRPDANIGIATGAVSGLVVLDVDPRHGGQESLQQLIDAHIRGLSRDRHRPDRGRWWPFLFRLSRSTGPESGRSTTRTRHPRRWRVCRGPAQSARQSGRRYVWEPSAHPENTPFAPLPPGLLDLIQAPAAPAGPLQDADGRWLIPEGSRHNTLLSLAGTMRRRPDFPQEAITAALLITNELYCVPPLDDAEVLSIAASIMQYPASGLSLGRRQSRRGPWAVAFDRPRQRRAPGGAARRGSALLLSRELLAGLERHPMAARSHGGSLPPGESDGAPYLLPKRTRQPTRIGVMSFWPMRSGVRLHRA